QFGREATEAMGQLPFQFAVMFATLAGAAKADAVVSVASPDGRVQIEVSVGDDGRAPAVPRYRVMYRGAEVIGSSRLGFELEGGSTLGGSCEIVAVKRQPVSENYTQITGKRREISSQATELIVTLRESFAPRR